MNKKKIIAGMAVGAAGVGATLVATKCLKNRNSVSRKKNKRNSEADMTERMVSDMEFSKEDIRCALETLFSKYSKEDLGLAIWCEDDTDGTVLTAAVEEYVDELYSYMERHSKYPDKFEGSRDDGDEIMYLNEELFYDPGVCICSELDEVYFDRFHLSNEIELWILETGEIAQVRCVSYKGEGGNVQYRYLEFYVDENRSSCFDIETIVDGLNSLLSNRD